MKASLYIDGGARGNPGPAGVGVVLRQVTPSQPLHEAGYFLGTATNNVAEYNGLIRGLQVAKEIGATELHIYSDSELLVKQIHGQYRVKSPDLKPLFERAKTLLTTLGRWSLEHVRREKNHRADELANMAMDARRDVVVIGAGAEAAPPPQTAEAPAEPETPPCWSAELTGSKRCLVGQSTGNAYTFGPTTPEGFCVWAAAAVLNEGPLVWNKAKRDGAAKCRRCGQGIKLVRVI